MVFKENKSRSFLAMTYLVLFIIFEILVMTGNNFLTSFDKNIQNLITPIVNSVNTSFFVAVSFLGSPVVSLLLAIFIAILIYSKKRRADGIWILLTYLGGDVLSFIVKQDVRRPRPTDKLVPDTGFSFPSGHIFGLTLLVLIVIYMVLPYVKNQETRFVLGILAIIWLLVVGFARVYLRGHFASDIFGSILLAGTWWKGCELLYLRYFEKVSQYLNLKID